MTATEFLEQEEQKLTKKYLNGPAYLSIIHESTRLLEKAQESDKEEDWQAWTNHRKASFENITKVIGLGEEFNKFLDDHSAILYTILAKADEWDEE